jgi:hypothetical protein
VHPDDLLTARSHAAFHRSMASTSLAKAGNFGPNGGPSPGATTVRPDRREELKALRDHRKALGDFAGAATIQRELDVEEMRIALQRPTMP